MAEDNFQERTEQATPRRREKAREQGRVAKSMELNSALMILLGFSTLLVLGPLMVTQTLEMLRGMLANAPTIAMSDPSFVKVYGDSLLKYLVIVGPVFGAMMLIGFMANVIQVGFKVSPKAMELKLDKLNVVAGFGRLFSTRSLVALLRDTIKLFIIGFVAYKVIKSESDNFMMLADMSIGPLAVTAGKMAIAIALKVGVAVLVLAILDFAYQKYDFEKSIRMSHQEVKEEYKETEGSPQIKARIRQIQRETARKRMMQDVPKADVVITNPTHFAVALKYNSEAMNAPTVIAKGQNLIAQKIKQIAYEHEIPVIEDKALAQALYKMCEVGQMVPHNLYRAVAEVLAYVYRLKGKVSK
jgi:flagellar biosynthetic protein FlhB